jgi:hypothetical protein
MLSSAAAVLAALAVPATATAVVVVPRVPVHVSPRSIGPHTAVTVSFHQPSPAGLLPDQREVEALRVQARGHGGCIDDGSLAMTPAPAGRLVRRTLRPARLPGGRWCPGTYHGEITLSQFPRCDPGPLHACPLYVIAPRTLATFSFRVSG